ncbi:unnamed protein product [Protopolystoma xenopodis]|uniref:Uncharacterized protein n=1 Tax=Protopolystoma xenopodis TaxID=117903 RepID=A0A448WYZ0_9PLAT|nr:unnamed protein product [Protopolystoma xenopodis]
MQLSTFDYLDSVGGLGAQMTDSSCLFPPVSASTDGFLSGEVGGGGPRNFSASQILTAYRKEPV